jgi:CheY-like chemotaxis protein
MPKRILIVDDHAPTRTAIRNMIEIDRSEEYEIVEAASGIETLTVIDKEAAFQLVLLDIELPKMDGFEVCKALRDNGIKTPVVFVTGRGGLEDFNKGRAAGGDSYLKKPVTRASLRSVVALFTSGSVTRT